MVCTKGRRFGATHGAAHACIEWALEGQKLLWGDTINSNIDRYFQRYFEPALRKSGISYSWNAQKKECRIIDGWIDFRSADRPENWEGFGYHKIFLNEAGIILKNDYLFTNAVLPMLIDFPESQLFAVGVPKGKKKKNGEKHKFYQLYERALSGDSNYKLYSFSSYDNPMLKKEDIEALEKEMKMMNPEMVKQEIYGEFVEGAAGLLWDMVIIERQRCQELPDLTRTVLAIDPATTSGKSSDDTGMMVVGKSVNNNAYVLEDATGKYTPEQWSRLAATLVRKHNCSAIVAETNQGGDMVESIIRQVDKNIRIKQVRAHKGKYLRAEPIFGLYERGKVWHHGFFPELENQMCTFNPDEQEKSPDRVDALVYGVQELIVNKREAVTL